MLKVKDLVVAYGQSQALHGLSFEAHKKNPRASNEIIQALSRFSGEALGLLDGLLDRAEETFERLRGTALDEEAKRNLLEIYQLGKDWERAIAIAKELPDVASRKEIA